MDRIEKDRCTVRWHVRESRYSIFHLEPPLDVNQALREVLADADSRTEKICQRLSLPRRANVIDFKTNWWFYSAAGAITGACGQVTDSGIDIYNPKASWREHIEPLIHEEIHALWGRYFGEAPALLNEGVPEYFQRIVQNDSLRRLRELEQAWQKLACEQGFLRRLCVNEGFWKAKMERKPVYGVAGMVVSYLVEHFGTEVLQMIFAETDYELNDLSTHLTAKIGKDADELERDINWYVAGGVLPYSR